MERWVRSLSLPEYMVSELGRVMKIPHTKKMPKGGERRYGGVPRVGVWDKKEKRYSFSYKGKNYKVAQLVCEAFHGPCPKGHVCMHVDENSRNNRADNVQWGTQKENLNAPGFIEYCKGRTGENSPYIKGRRKM